jgi:hypothetical protein
MSPIKRSWVFSFLWINFAVVIVVLILIAGNQISSGRELLHLLVFSLFYANLTGILGVLILGGLAGKLLHHPQRSGRATWRPKRACVPSKPRFIPTFCSTR